MYVARIIIRFLAYNLLKIFYLYNSQQWIKERQAVFERFVNELRKSIQFFNKNLTKHKFDLLMTLPFLYFHYPIEKQKPCPSES